MEVVVARPEIKFNFSKSEMFTNTCGLLQIIPEKPLMIPERHNDSFIGKISHSHVSFKSMLDSGLHLFYNIFKIY